MKTKPQDVYVTSFYSSNKVHNATKKLILSIYSLFSKLIIHPVSANINKLEYEFKDTSILKKLYNNFFFLYNKY